MFHSSYVASKLGIWKERGRKRLTGLLAKMGYVHLAFNSCLLLKLNLLSFSIPQTQQPYSHMDTDLKQQLRSKLDAIAPEYGMVELSYPSFLRHYGFRARPLGAADAVEAVSALLDVAGGVRMEVEIEGTRGGGEWFGGGRVWALADRERWRDERGGASSNGITNGANTDVTPNPSGENTGGEKAEVQWWVRNFWSAFDALDE
jgi:cell division control protein 45